MVKKNTNSINGELYIIGSALFLLLIVVAALFVKADFMIKKEQAGFESLKADSTTLQTELNKIDSGWVYDESCYGEGGVYQRDIPSFCEITLTKIQTEPSKLSTDYTAYINATENLFTVVNPTQVSKPSFSNISDAREIRSTGFSYKKFESTKCSFYEFYDNDDHASVSGGAQFRCSHDANRFYFDRRDR